MAKAEVIRIKNEQRKERNIENKRSLEVFAERDRK